MTRLATAIDEVEAAIRAQVPTAHYLFIEPDVRRAVANAATDLAPTEVPAAGTPDPARDD